MTVIKSSDACEDHKHIPKFYKTTNDMDINMIIIMNSGKYFSPLRDKETHCIALADTVWYLPKCSLFKKSKDKK